MRLPLLLRASFSIIHHVPCSCSAPNLAWRTKGDGGRGVVKLLEANSASPNPAFLTCNYPSNPVPHEHHSRTPPVLHSGSFAPAYLVLVAHHHAQHLLAVQLVAHQHVLNVARRPAAFNTTRRRHTKGATRPCDVARTSVAQLRLEALP